MYRKIGSAVDEISAVKAQSVVPKNLRVRVVMSPLMKPIRARQIIASFETTGLVLYIEKKKIKLFSSK